MIRTWILVLLLLSGIAITFVGLCDNAKPPITIIDLGLEPE